MHEFHTKKVNKDCLIACKEINAMSKSTLSQHDRVLSGIELLSEDDQNNIQQKVKVAFPRLLEHVNPSRQSDVETTSKPWPEIRDSQRPGARFHKFSSSACWLDYFEIRHVFSINIYEDGGWLARICK